MYWQGWVLLIITLSIATAMITCNRWIKKITNFYFLWLGISLFALIWLFVFRFLPDIQKYESLLNTSFDPTTYDNSKIISRAFLLDFCPFLVVLLLISLIADPSRKVARSIAPIGVLAGGLVMIVQPGYAPVELTAQYIFLGVGGNACYFIMHFILFIFSLGVMLNTPKGGLPSLGLTTGIAAIFYIYVAIMMSITKCNWFVSGLSLNDWSSIGNYRVLTQFTGIPYYYCPILGFPLMIGAVIGIDCLKNFVFNKSWWAYGNARSNKWYAWYNYNKTVKQKGL